VESPIQVHYIQKGVLLHRTQITGSALADDLALSFARALGRFYPLAGRFVVTEISGGASGSGACLTVSLSCSNDGAEFVHAVAPGVSMSDIISPRYFPPVLRSFFPSNGMLCGDAMLEPRPLLGAQVTELADGVFVALSLNHAVADGTTFWHLFNTWSEIHRSGARRCELSTPLPVLSRWFPDACPVPVTLPFMKVEDIIQRVEFPPVRECFFHLSTASVRNLKAKANAEMTGTAQSQADPISSLQAVLAHLWRGACRARRLPPDRETICLLPVGCRGRVQGVPQHYMGNAVALGVAKCTVAHVVDKGLGCTAWLLNQAVASFDEAKTRDALASWHQKPHILYLEASGDGDPADIVVAASPRFDVYGNDFGRGTPVAVRSGAGNKMDGVVTVYPGRDGGGSMGVCMSPEALARLTADREFMEVVYMA
jgi:hypothetical protein